MMKFFKWKKILVVLGVVVGIGIISSLAIRWPINTFPPIEGKLLDATTRDPLENVVVSVNWIRSSPGPAGEITRTIKRDIAVTDKEGKYRIPRLWSFHLFSVFSRGYIGFNHPLYASKAAVVAREGRKIIIGSPALKAYPEEFEYKHGILHYDIELLSLEENYIRAIEWWKSKKVTVDRQNQIEKLLGNLWSEIWNYYTAGEARGYFVTMKKLGITNITLDKVVKEWKKIVNKVQDYEQFYNKLLNDIGEVEKSNRQSLEKAGC